MAQFLNLNHYKKYLSLCAITLSCAALAGCGGGKKSVDYGVKASPRVVADGQPIPKGGGAYRVGKEYKVGGRWYQPREDVNYDKTGIASWYGKQFHGRLTANGEVFDMNALSVAHKTLPMPTYVRVTNLANGRSIMARVNDRGPYHDNREIDLSYKVAQVLGITRTGTGKVRVQYAGRARLDGKDDHLFQTAQLNGQPTTVASLLSSDGVQYASSREKQLPRVQVASLVPVSSDAWRAESSAIKDNPVKSETIAKFDPEAQIVSTVDSRSQSNNIDMAYVDSLAPKIDMPKNIDMVHNIDLPERPAIVHSASAANADPLRLDMPRPRPHI